jgi:hypothetical protein
MRALLVLSFGGILLIATLGRVLGDEDRSIHPVHALHAEMEIECETCHADAWTSVAGTDDLLPSKDVCADCHDVDDDEECGICHVSVDEPEGYATRAVAVGKFAHAPHVDNGMDCGACHPAHEGEPGMPEKASCRVCHATVSQMSDCQICHVDSEPRLPASHDPQWISLHAVEAAWNDVGCANCHTQTDCQECHAGDNVRPLTHRLNYAFDHALDARGNEIRCASCHEDPQYCVSCHVASQVQPRNHSRADWVLSTGGQHAEEARFNMESCVACHDAGAASPMCARCHGD